MAADLSRECLEAASVGAFSLESLRQSHAADKVSYPFTVHRSRGDLTDAFPQPCRDLAEALEFAPKFLGSPEWKHDWWVRIDGPNGQSWDTAGVRRLAADQRP